MKATPASTESDTRAAGGAGARILVADPIAEDGLQRLRDIGDVDVHTGMSPEELLAAIADYDVLVVRSETKVTAAVLAAASRLRVIGRAGVGVDNIDVAAATDHGVLVLNAPTGNTIAAAEHAVAMMMALARNIPQADNSLRQGHWERSVFTGFELREKTLGLLGLGKIGFEVARIAAFGLQMRVLAHDPVATPERAEQAGAELVSLSDLLRQSDVISLHVPLNEHTRGLLNRETLAQAKPGVRIINVARGGIVDEAALAAAIESGAVSGAAIDVFGSEPPAADNPLLHLPGVIVTPHLGASTAEAQVNVAFDVAEQIAQYLAGGSPRYAVNAPAMMAEELEKIRPYLALAEKMGSLAAQLLPGRVRQVICSYAGELAEADVSLITAGVLRGLFGHFTETRVNPINAKVVARSLGVDVDERSTTRHALGADPLYVEVVGEERLRLAGTHYDAQPRITRINDFRVDVDPYGIFLVVQHRDRPGVVAAISTLLAKHDINIAGMELGRKTPRGTAMMLMQIDDPIAEELLPEIREQAGLESLRLVHL